MIKASSLSGNNPIDLANKAVERGDSRGTPSLSISNSLHRIGEGQIPTALENHSAWERERSLGRGLKEVQKRGGNMAVRVRVKSNSHRGKTEIIDDLVLHFDNDGWASIPAGEAYKVEAYAAKRPGRITVVREEVKTAEDLLAEAQAAMAAVAEPEVPVAEQAPPVVVPAEVPTEQEAADELGLDLSQVEEEQAPPVPVKEPPKPKKASKKKE